MKKLYYILCALPMLLLAACGDDDKVPEFDVEVTFAPEVNVVDNVITVPQGESFTIESVRPVNSTAKEITFGTVTYQIDYGLGFPTMVKPYTATFSTDGLRVGRHMLRIFIGVWAVDYSPANAIVSYYLDVTEPLPDEGGDTPGGGEEGDPDQDAPTVLVVHPSVKPA
ncbi:hypothetical protein [uncultured Muribaculum sp.]|uniref:hypothetical protein n=1 Tax=uncultured Muribaculum sp. TaxID=1918613 RepID=UPI0025D6BCE8|nr:hypothetical protein [uncultured Muribaculum sp.]